MQQGARRDFPERLSRFTRLWESSGRLRCHAAENPCTNCEVSLLPPPLWGAARFPRAVSWSCANPLTPGHNERRPSQIPLATVLMRPQLG